MLRAAAQVHNAHNKNSVAPDLVKNALGKTVRQASPSANREFRPREWKFDDSSHCLSDLVTKFPTQPCFGTIIIIKGIAIFTHGHFRKLHFHDYFPE